MNVDSTSMRKNLLQLLQSARSGSPAMDVFGQHDVVSNLKKMIEAFNDYCHFVAVYMILVKYIL